MLCELGAEHEGGHADLLWHGADSSIGVWARWNDVGTVEFVPLPWCGAENEAGKWCSMFTEHPPGHQWDVTDPTRMAQVVDARARLEEYRLRQKYI
ncbi:hypothetical protein ACWDUX_30315 [Streptomyces sp. NPDC003444]